MKMKIFNSAIAILCLAQLPDSNAKVRIFEKSFVGNVSNEEFIMDDERLTHVECDDQKPIRCKIEQLTIPYENPRYSCNISLKEDLTYQNLSMHPFGKDKFIFLQHLYHEVVISILHLDKCRTSEEFRLPKPESDAKNSHIGTIVVTYNDTFDIFYRDANRCGEKACKATIDAEGKLIAGPIPMISRDNGGYVVNEILPIAAQSPEKGYVYAMIKEGVETLPLAVIKQGIFALSFLHPNGTEQLFARDLNVECINTNNEQIGVCAFLGPEENVTCAQYDNLGNVKLQKDISEPDRSVAPFYLYNLPGGGFLSLVFVARVNVITDMSVRKINVDGVETGKIKIRALDETRQYVPELSSSRTHIWKGEDEEYCVALVGKYELGGYGVVVNCFDDADFLN